MWLVYNSLLKEEFCSSSRDVFACIDICIRDVIAFLAVEDFSFSIFFCNVQTVFALLRGVSWINEQHKFSLFFCLVLQIASKLCICPVASLPVKHFSFSSLSNAFQIFYCKCSIR